MAAYVNDEVILPHKQAGEGLTRCLGPEPFTNAYQDDFESWLRTLPPNLDSHGPEAPKLGSSNMGQTMMQEFTDQRSFARNTEQYGQNLGKVSTAGLSLHSSTPDCHIPTPEQEGQMHPGSSSRSKRNKFKGAVDSSSRPVESSFPRMSAQSSTQCGIPPHGYAFLGICNLSSPWVLPQQDCASSLSKHIGHQYPFASNSGVCSISEADCPQPDHQAAHVLTVLRSGYDQGASCFNGSMTTLCQQQVCTKDDCPPDTQVRCPSEDLEIQQCDGNCSGRLCSGVGCPYNIPCALVQSPFECDASSTEDLWPCAWPPTSKLCGSAAMRGIVPQHSDLNVNAKSRDYSFPCSEHLIQGSTLCQTHPQHIIRSDIICSTTSECCDLWGPCEEPSCNFDEFCNFHTQGDDCLLAHCDQVPGGLDPGKPINKTSFIPNPTLGTAHPLSPLTSDTTTPFTISDSDSKANEAKILCKWVTNQSSGETCGYCCEHGNDLQSHIENCHINGLAGKSSSRQKKGSTRPQKDLFCRWQGCKYHLQKKGFGQTQSLKQHLYTHSGFKGAQCPICEQWFVDKTNLEGHMRTHTGEKPFKCSHCDARFAARSTWITHERTHTGEKPLVCHICGHVDGDSSNFERHKWTHRPPRFPCEVCGSNFKRREHLNRHKVTCKGKDGKGGRQREKKSAE